MECGMDINAKDNEGLKPVDLAKENNHQDAYQLLFRVTKPKLLVTFDITFHPLLQYCMAFVLCNS